MRAALGRSELGQVEAMWAGCAGSITRNVRVAGRGVYQLEIRLKGNGQIANSAGHGQTG